MAEVLAKVWRTFWAASLAVLADVLADASFWRTFWAASLAVLADVLAGVLAGVSADRHGSQGRKHKADITHNKTTISFIG